MTASTSGPFPPFTAARHATWRQGLRELRDGLVTLRELSDADAPSLFTHLGCDSLDGNQAAAPSSVAGFQRFIDWATEQRRGGCLACYGIVPFGQPAAVGMIQFWPIERDFFVAEWGFALGKAFWGSGVFMRAATLAVDAAFCDLGVYRLEARSVEDNARTSRVFEKLGATRDGVLRGAFRDGNRVRNHVLWSILAPEWQARRDIADAS